MAKNISINHNDEVIQSYFDDLAQLKKQGLTRETNVRGKLFDVVKFYGKMLNLQFVEEWKIKGTSRTIDAALLQNNVPFGYIEAKDDGDDLYLEIEKKIKHGYPITNTLFWQPSKAVLFRDGKEFVSADISTSLNDNAAKELVKILREFLFAEPRHIIEWNAAVKEFELLLPQLAEELRKLIEKEFYENYEFAETFKYFFEVCRGSLNPNLRQEAVVEMVIQHILIKRVFIAVFQYDNFVRRNAIANEIQKVVDSLTNRSFSEDDFLTGLKFAYSQIGKTAELIEDFYHKQAFLNHFYELFFKLVNPRIADTHGIVYTPREVVNFMVNSVDVVLEQEFGLTLGSHNVHILDPFVGTGNFLHAIIKHIAEGKGGKHLLKHKYEHELHANELTLMAYYIATMNIEHEYFEQTGENKQFGGLCLVDTFEIAEMANEDVQLFQPITEENSERIRRQKDSPIFVVIGNPPYNANQANENDNNKNRKYPAVDNRIRETYAKLSKATNKNMLFDPYVRAFRYASDRIMKNQEGILAFITNNSFLTDIAFDGMRKSLTNEYDRIYLLDLGGNVRKNPKLSGTTHNIFGIQVGVCIAIALKSKTPTSQNSIFYARLDEFATKEFKYDFLTSTENFSRVEWTEIIPDERGAWLREGLHDDFITFLPMGTKEAKSGNGKAIFGNYSNGVKTNRDVWTYNFNPEILTINIKTTIDFYNSEVIRWQNFRKSSKYQIRLREITGKDEAEKIGLIVDEFVKYDDTKLSWSSDLKLNLLRGNTAKYEESNVRSSLYRPFTKEYLYFDKLLNERRYQVPTMFPTAASEQENRVICVSGIGSSKDFHCLMTDVIPCLDLLEKTQCFPLYTYTESGERRENISDWALKEYRAKYGKSVSKQDIFHYIYAVLHHPAYRTKYAANLRRDLPRGSVSN